MTLFSYKPVTFSSNFVHKYLYSVTQNTLWLKRSSLSWLEAFGRVRLAVCPCFQFMPRQDKVNRAIKSLDVCGHITVALILIHFEDLMANQHISCKVKIHWMIYPVMIKLASLLKRCHVEQEHAGSVINTPADNFMLLHCLTAGGSNMPIILAFSSCHCKCFVEGSTLSPFLKTFRCVLICNNTEAQFAHKKTPLGTF